MSNKKHNSRIRRRMDRQRAKEAEARKEAAAYLQASKYGGYLNDIADQRDRTRIFNIILLLIIAGLSVWLILIKTGVLYA